MAGKTNFLLPLLLKKNKNRKLTERKSCYVNIHNISLPVKDRAVKSLFF